MVSLVSLLKSMNLDAYITPMEDEHLNEFIGRSDARVEFLTGFKGTAGVAITTVRGSGFLTDGRYYNLAKRELKDYELLKENETDVANYLQSLFSHTTDDNKSARRTRVGTDMRFFDHQTYRELEESLAESNIDLVHVSDLVDRVWDKRPKRSFNPIVDLERFLYRKRRGKLTIFDMEEKSEVLTLPHVTPEIHDFLNDKTIPGTTRAEKLRAVKKTLKKDEYILFTELDTIAWLLNLRGSDIPHNQLFYSYLIVSGDSAVLFANYYLEIGNDIELKPYEAFQEALESIKTKRVIVSHSCNAFIAKKLENKLFSAHVRRSQSLKNMVEVFGMYFANVLDSALLVQLYEWIEDSKNVSEIEIGRKFAELGDRVAGVLRTSFEPVVAIGTNSAALHHRNGTKKLTKKDIVMIDSGNQYLFGTTDITRTLALHPTEEQKEKYTYVLKAVIAAKDSISSFSTAGTVDEAARKVLRSINASYESATGHGIGAGLVIHESPPHITKNAKNELIEGEIFTIEPGYYEDNKFGVRIEDTVVIMNDKGKKVFRDLVYVPLHLNLIKKDLLTQDEATYVNDYSGRTYEIIKNVVGDGPGIRYLFENTRPV